ncbi:GNAT family N-acetyltransferase [Paraliomyxa miuraensis]|uniref:GNAT family N-acetyltransferase n=1 Tax=Paraliomyxa miuraensis TaxID=376150 RepID=UPI002257514D|nr:GNAT family N-acetyltransferase [Paraliomyxa miuraensis]MCX4247144.1 GNAT family N-acetyltransferase [Paraliomyxa miuraensis]
MTIERAIERDARSIARVLRANAAVRSVVLLSSGVIRRHIDEFIVIREPGRALVACAQLRWPRPNVAELAGVAVHPARQGEGLGRALVRACVERAMRRNPRLLWLVTSRPAWLERLGFERMPLGSVPMLMLLDRLRLMTHQSWTRWPGTLGGPHVLMRWSGGW